MSQSNLFSLTSISHRNLLGCLISLPEFEGMEVEGAYVDCLAKNPGITGSSGVERFIYKLRIGPYDFPEWYHDCLPPVSVGMPTDDYSLPMLKVLASSGLTHVFDENPFYLPMAFELLEVDDPVPLLKKELVKHSRRCIRSDWYLPESSYDVSFVPHILGVSADPRFKVSPPKDYECLGNFESKGAKYDMGKSCKLTADCCGTQVTREDIIVKSLDPLASSPLPICPRLEECKNARLLREDA